MESIKVRLALAFIACSLACVSIGILLETWKIPAPWDLIVAAAIGAATVPTCSVLIIGWYE